MEHKPVAGRWMTLAFLMALGLAAAVLAVSGTEAKGIVRALQLTARFSFLLFWCAYAGNALHRLFGPTFRPLARHGREFGLAFASAHLIHLGLVVWLYIISEHPPVSTTALVFFSTGLFWTYLLALFSIQRLSQTLGAVAWRLLRLVGLEYISFAFLVDFNQSAFHANLKSLIGYLPFVILSVAGTFLRLTAWIDRRGNRQFAANWLRPWRRTDDTPFPHRSRPVLGTASSAPAPRRPR